MSIPYRTLLVCIILALALVPAFSQDTKTQKTEQKTPVATPPAEPRTDGLVRIKTRPSDDWNIPLDEEALEANIERALEDVEMALEKLEDLKITIDPIAIPAEVLHLDPIDIAIPDLDLDIDIEPIDLDLEDIDITIDPIEDDADWDIDREEELDEMDTHRKTTSDRSEKSNTEKDKTKGLKKIN